MKIAVLLLAVVLGMFFPVLRDLVFQAVGPLASPVSVQLVAPTSGATVSNTITLTATASSTAARIQRVEFYEGTQLLGVVTNLPAEPTNFRTVPQ